MSDTLPTKRPLKIGLTGGIGSGKTTVAKIFNTLNIPIYYADDSAKWLMQHDEKVIQAIKQLFGEEVYTSNQELNRPYLANIVFKDKTALKQLESIVHPAVFKHSEQWLQNQPDGTPYVIREAALTFESGSYKFQDKVITVYAPEQIRIERVKERDNTTVEQIKARMNKQMPDAEKVKLADFVIYNDGQQLLIPQVLKIHRLILKQT